MQSIQEKLGQIFSHRTTNPEALEVEDHKGFDIVQRVFDEVVEKCGMQNLNPQLIVLSRESTLHQLDLGGFMSSFLAPQHVVVWEGQLSNYSNLPLLKNEAQPTSVKDIIDNVRNWSLSDHIAFTMGHYVTDQEALRGVLAHELGHVKFHHTHLLGKSRLSVLSASFGSLFGFSWLASQGAAIVGIASPWLLLPISFITALPFAAFTFKFVGLSTSTGDEFEADAHAAAHFPEGGEKIMRRLLTQKIADFILDNPGAPDTAVIAHVSKKSGPYMSPLKRWEFFREAANKNI
jgi:Peptidase family M48